MLIYLSQMAGLYRDPHGKKIFEKNKSTISTSTEAKKVAATLKKRVSELEKKLTEVRQFAAYRLFSILRCKCNYMKSDIYIYHHSNRMEFHHSNRMEFQFWKEVHRA